METIEYYKTRLEDQYLLEKSIKIGEEVFVPVGGKRIIGSKQFSNKYASIEVFYILYKKCGFPNLRFKVGSVPYALKTWSLMWGERIEDNDFYKLSLKERGRLFGYKESVLVDD